MNLVSRVKIMVSNLIFNFIRKPFYILSIPKKAEKLRKKEKINVLFVVTELGSWKTEMLYKMMLTHNRFEPIIGITASTQDSNSKEKLRQYLHNSNLSYYDLDQNTEAQFKEVKADLIFYQKPYDLVYSNYKVLYKNHLDSLFCFVNYAFNSLNTKWACKEPLFPFLWQHYFENQYTASDKRRAMMERGGKNIVITGLPIQDQLMVLKDSYTDPWKASSSPRKRIIFAPHHTIGDFHLDGIGISTFLETGEIMLEMMKKYENQIQWAFKPHPLLYGKLLLIWGKERTDCYYNEWRKSDNSQFVDGKYDALFKYSDALIHDCCSFTMEYLYTQNPVMYLTRDGSKDASRNGFAQRAFNLHYKGCTRQEIEKFILNVINNQDNLRNEKTKYYNECLIPPHGRTACENIINAILGEADYST